MLRVAHHFDSATALALSGNPSLLHNDRTTGLSLIHEIDGIGSDLCCVRRTTVRPTKMCRIYDGPVRHRETYR